MSRIRAEFTTGTYVSAVSHAGLIGWLLLGWGLQAEPLPFEVTEVSVVTGAEYDAMVSATTPAAATQQPVAPTEPTPQESLPEVTPEEPVTPRTPDVAPAQPEDEAPPPDAPEAVPEAEVDETLPVMEAPATPVAPDLPVISERPQERPADRVADAPVAPPPPEAEAAPEVQQEVTDAPSDAPSVEDIAQEETAPEAANERLVTEAEEASGAPRSALRPPSRPADLRPPPPPETPGETTVADSAGAAEPDDSTLDDLLTDLAAEPANESVPGPTGDPGPPMSFSEREGFRVAVSDCWTVDAGAQESVIVTVFFELGRDRRVVGNLVELVSGEGGSDAAINAAYQRARRAILMCQNRGNGFPLPDDKFEQWREVRMTFDPSNVRF